MVQKNLFRLHSENAGRSQVILPLRREPTIGDLERMLCAIMDFVSRGYRENIVDLTGVESLTPAAAGFLSVMKHKVTAAGGDLRLRVRPGGPQRLLGIYGLANSVEGALVGATA